MRQAMPTMIATGLAVEPRPITTGDVRLALMKGLDDFRAMPTHYLFFALLYAVLGLLFARMAAQFELMPMIFPLTLGFALLGPILALGLVELSRRREQGQDTAWWRMFSVLRSPAITGILGLALLLLLLFAAWLRAAWVIYASTFGPLPLGPGEFLGELFTTRQGWALIILGNGIGALFALTAFSISVIAFPMMLDRHVGMWTAIGTSIQSVLLNPLPMLAWGLVVAIGLAIGSVPLFLGLAIVLPILGHGTWHLYRAVMGQG